MFCRSLIVLFLLAIVLSVLQFKDSDYSFGIFKLFLFTKINHNNLTSFSTIFNTHNLKHILMSNILCISVRENRRGHPDLVNWETWATLESIFKQRQKTKETHTQQRKLNRWATRTTKISGKDPGTREGSAFPASYKTPDKLPIKSRRVGHPYAQTNTNHIINHDKEMGVEPNRMSFLCGNRSRHHNTEIIKWRHTIEQNEHCGDFIGCKNNIRLHPYPLVSLWQSKHRPIGTSHCHTFTYST